MGLNWTKPPVGTGIDWGSQLARGLVGCWPFNEGAGSTVLDYVSGVVGTITGAAWVSTPYGPGLSFTKTTGQQISFGTPPWLTNVVPYTLAWRLVLRSRGQSAVSAVASKGANWSMTTSDNIGNNWRLFHDSSVSSYSTNGAVNTLNIGSWQSFASTCSGSGSYLQGWQSGIEIAYFNQVGSGSMASDSGSNLLIGNSVGGSDCVDAIFDYFYFYNRVLSSGELASLGADPWQVFQSPAPWYFIEHSAGAAPTFSPAWASRSGIVVGSGVG